MIEDEGKFIELLFQTWKFNENGKKSEQLMQQNMK